MKTYKLKAYENISARFEEVHGPQVFQAVGEFTVSLETPSVMAALEALYEIGNLGGHDAQGKVWPRNRRSLSVGDLAVVGASKYTCARAGWRKTSAKHTLKG